MALRFLGPAGRGATLTWSDLLCASGGGVRAGNGNVTTDTNVGLSIPLIDPALGNLQEVSWGLSSWRRLELTHSAGAESTTGSCCAAVCGGLNLHPPTAASAARTRRQLSADNLTPFARCGWALRSAAGCTPWKSWPVTAPVRPAWPCSRAEAASLCGWRWTRRRCAGVRGQPRGVRAPSSPRLCGGPREWRGSRRGPWRQTRARRCRPLWRRSPPAGAGGAGARPGARLCLRPGGGRGLPPAPGLARHAEGQRRRVRCRAGHGGAARDAGPRLRDP